VCLSARDCTPAVDGKPVTVVARPAAITAGNEQVESLSQRDMRSHVVGDTAVVSMAAESNGECKGKPNSQKSRGMDYIVRRDGH
jgi:hypothetical protein